MLFKVYLGNYRYIIKYIGIYTKIHLGISMQRIEFAKKSTSKNQKQSTTVEEINRRKEERIAALISSRRIYRIEHSDVFWVESSKDNVYHYCKITFTSKQISNFVHVRISNTGDILGIAVISK